MSEHRIGFARGTAPADYRRAAGRWVWLGMLALLFALHPALAQDAEAAEAGEIVSVLGVAEVLRKGRWQAVGAGEKLAAGETVRAGSDGRLAIQLANGSQFKLNAGGQLELKAVAPPSKGVAPATTDLARTILRLLGGELWARSVGEPLEIQTVPATATIRGTEFGLAVGPGDVARLAVLEGVVELANPQGGVLVAANEQATAKAGEAPRKTVLLNPLDAVQWSLYYPDPAGDRAERERAERTDPRSSRYWTWTARNHLLRGQVPEARRALDRALALDPNDARAYSLRAAVALVQNRKAEARADAERAVAADPAAPEGHLALSWVQQAEFDLDGALANARRAVALDPDDPHALIQESRLLFGMGRTGEAAEVAEKARQRAPDDALVHSTRGFLHLARGRTDEAVAAFEAAIARDSTLGEPHLGLGIARFRQNRTEDAVAAIRKATLLEPKVSLYNSYLGKAHYETGDDRLASQYLAAAKQLDPRDPTPHFYDAIRAQSVNRPVEAVRDLQKSIDLNDNRAVYRSRLLLDEDLAARDAALGKLYNELGFAQLGLNEGRKSLASDPANHSAHRLLADSYAAVPGVEAARASELLQAQLLQPINITPISPQMAETKLLMPGAGPITPSLYEFNPLFVRNRPTLFVSGLGGNQDTWGDEVIVSGLTDRFAYSFGQFHYQNDGYRPNNDLENNLYNLFVQTAVTPDFSLQAEYRHRETINGDRRSQFDGSFFSNRRRSVDQETARIGARYSLSPQTTAIASVVYTDREGVVSSKASDFRLAGKSRGTQAEAQLLYKAEPFNVIAGLGGYSFDFSSSDSDNPSGEPDANIAQQIAYGYANIKIPDNVIWTVGLSYQSDDNANANLDEFNPKFGVQWAITDRVSLRAAAFKAVKRALAFEQTIEPTQVAGFNQLADYIDETVVENYGVALDVRFSPQLFGGLEALRRDTDVPLGLLSQPEFYEVAHNKEDFYSAYLYWLPNRNWALSASLRYEKIETDQNCALCLFLYPAELQTFSIPLSVQYFDPSGFFAGLGVVYVNQDIQAIDPESSVPGSFVLTPTQNEEFTLVDIGLGYRLLKRWGIVALQVNNVFDEEFRYQDYSFQTGTQTENPLYIPERTVLGRLILNF